MSWGPLDVALAAVTTMSVIVAVLSFAMFIGEMTGFEPALSSGSQMVIGGPAVAIAYLATRYAKTQLWPLSVALVGSALVISLAYLFASEDGNGSAVTLGVPVSIIVATAMSSSFAVVAIGYSVVRYREPFTALGFDKTDGIKPYVFAVGMWLIGLSVLLFWVQALVWFGVDSLVPPDTAKKALDEAGGSIVVTIVLVGILGPIAEEIFFRGYVLPGLVKRFGIGWALLLSSVMFGLFHIDPGAIVPTFALGLALGWVYLKTGSIWPAMFAHGLHNTVAVLIAKYVSAA